jgi:hypothetical protein
LARVESLGGSVIHPGEIWAICKDSEGSPFGLALRAHVPNGSDSESGSPSARQAVPIEPDALEEG